MCTVVGFTRCVSAPSGPPSTCAHPDPKTCLQVLGEEAAAAAGGVSDVGGAAKEKTLEEITLEMLEQLGAAVLLA